MVKTKIISLIIAQAFATFIMIGSNAGIYTSLCIYAAQSIIIFFFLALSGLSDENNIQKIITLIQLYFFSGFYIAIFFLLYQLNGSIVLDPDGTSRILNIGEVSIISLILSSIGFVVHEVVNIRRNEASKLRNDSIINMRFFFISFAYVSEMILVVFIAVAFSSRGISIIMIAVIKTILDIGVLVLTKSLKSIDHSLENYKRL